MSATPEQVAAGNAVLDSLAMEMSNLGLNINQLNILITSTEYKRIKTNVMGGVASIRRRIRERLGNLPQEFKDEVAALAKEEVKAKEAKAKEAKAKEAKDKKKKDMDDDTDMSDGKPLGGAVSRPRPQYRFQKEPELRRMKQVKAEIAQVDEEMELHEDAVITMARKSHDPELKAFVVEWDQLESKTGEETAKLLAANISILGSKFKGKTIQDIANFRSSLIIERDQLEKKKDAIKAEYDKKFIDELLDNPELLKKRVKLEDFPKIIQDCDGYYLHRDADVSARKLMKLVKEAKEERQPNFAFKTDVFCYSVKSGCVVQMSQRKNPTGKGWLPWDFSLYSVPCTYDEALAMFLSIQGTNKMTVDVKKDVGEDDDGVTTVDIG